MDLNPLLAKSLTTLTIVWCLCTSASAEAFSFGGLKFHTIALSGETATHNGLGPNLGGAVHFTGFGFPVLNSAGEVAFNAGLTGEGVDTSNNAGIWRTSGASATLVARKGGVMSAPGCGEGVRFASFGSPVLNDVGQVAFFAQLEGRDVHDRNRSGIWMEVDGSVRIVARTGLEGPTPGLGADVYFRKLDGVELALNGMGQLAFLAVLTGEGVLNEFAVFRCTNAGPLTVAAREKDAEFGPGLGDAVVFGSIAAPTLSASGTIAFWCRVEGPGLGGGSPRNEGIWSVDAQGRAAAVAREGDAVAGSSAELRDFGRRASINAGGVVGFQAGLRGTAVNTLNDAAIVVVDRGSSAAAARKGEPAFTGGHTVFRGFDTPGATLRLNPVVNARGELAFAGSIDDPQRIRAYGVWVTRDGADPVPVAVTSVQGPGPSLGEGVHFADLSWLSINAKGDVAFLANLAGPGVGPDNDLGIWMTAGGALVKVVREGDQFDVDPTDGEDLRIIRAVGLGRGSGGEDGLGRVLSDDGLLVFRLTFSDGSSGVFTADSVPSGGGS